MNDSHPTHKLAARLAHVEKGGAPKYHEGNAQQGKLFCRKRIELLVDPGSFVEDGALANVLADDLPADGVVTGMATMHGREANDSTVKAGSWGELTVEKIIRIQEAALRYRLPMLYLVDSAGARITDQIEMFPGRRHAGRIFHNEVKLSGLVPQICLLFGPSAAGGAYIPAFCDVIFMVDKNASMYLGSPRMAEMVIGEKITLEELGGAKMHTSESGCADFLCKTEEEAIQDARAWLEYFPQRSGEKPALAGARPPKASRLVDEIVPADEKTNFDIKELIEAVVLRGEEAFCQGGGLRPGAHRGTRGGPGGQSAQGEGRRAVRGQRRQGRALHLAVRRLRDPPGVSHRCARLHDRLARGEAGHHPSWRQDDRGHERGHRAAHLRGGAQGLRRGSVRHERPGL
jgi:acetyl-CoA carboxylase carboxyltransferase component